MKSIEKSAATSKLTAKEIFARELAEHKASSLSVDEYLYYAACTIQREIAEGWKHTSTPVFEFARYVKGHPKLRWHSADNAWQAISKWLAGLAEANALTVEQLFELFFGKNLEEGMTEFLAVWKDVRYPKGYTAADLAMENNRLYPIKIDNPRTQGYQNFIGICYWLHRAMGGKPIALPQKDVWAKKLRVSQRTISYWIGWAIEHEYLALARRHKHVPEGKGRAATYYFNPKEQFTAVRSGTGFRLQLDNGPLSIATEKSEISNAELDAMHGVQ
jgi:hypothetical protein